jgi:glyoxylase-like metal-dependent hydrolase (beta-lactamase superfamily II)
MKLQVGELEIWVLETGYFRLDGGAMFGLIPKTLWSQKLSPDEQNRIPLGLRTLLVKAPGYTAIVDAGMGTKWGSSGPKNFDLRVRPWSEILAPTGLRPQDVDHVIATHLHFDHVGGLTEFAEDGSSLRPVFEKAEHWVSQRNWDFAQDSGPRESASYRAENWAPWVKSGQMRLVDISSAGDPQPLLPGLWAETSDGHTLGQMIVHLRSGRSDGNVVFCADLLPTQHHIKETWGMGFDLQPQVLLQEKRRFLESAVRHNWGLILEHDPTRALIHVEKMSGESRGGNIQVRPDSGHLKKS